MPDYSLGKIYKIVGNGKVYVGSTTRPLLSQRLAKHRCEYKGWVNGRGGNTTSYECITDPECYIELLELCPCSCKDELLKCEGKWIQDLECVNKLVAGRTQKEYREAHKEILAVKNKAYHEANKDEILEQMKAYYDANKEAILEKKKTYYLANKEAILEKARARYYENEKKINESV